MNAILENPFRQLGILSSSSAAEKRKQVKRLQMFLEAGEEPEEDYSFPVIGEFDRDLQSVKDSESHINLDNDKIRHSLFWFCLGNAITDEPAFDLLKEEDEEGASEIWERLVPDFTVTKRNFSAFSNLSTIHLNNAFLQNDVGLLAMALKLKLALLESDYVRDFVKINTDDTFRISKNDLQTLFLTEVKKEIEDYADELSDAFVGFISREHFTAKEDFMKLFVQKSISNIEKKIGDSKEKRKRGKSFAYSSGNTLIKETAEDFKLVKSTLSSNDMRFTSISDKLALEIFSCGLDYFMLNRDKETDPGANTMKIFRYAKNLAKGSIATQKIDENIDQLQEWIDEKPERDKQKKIEADFLTLKDIIDDFEDASPTIENAAAMLSRAKRHLQNIKNILGSYDELYLGLSTRIAADAQGMCVEEINFYQKFIAETTHKTTQYGGFLVLKNKVEEAWKVSNTLSGMDVKPDFKQRIQTNKKALSDLRSQLSGIGGSSSGGYSPAGPISTSNEDSWVSQNPGCAIFIGIFILYALAQMCS